VITTRPVTYTAATSSKIYDGTTVSSSIPTLTSGTLAAGDSVISASESYDNANAGASHVMTPVVTVTNGFQLRHYFGDHRHGRDQPGVLGHHSNGRNLPLRWFAARRFRIRDRCGRSESESPRELLRELQCSATTVAEGSSCTASYTYAGDVTTRASNNSASVTITINTGAISLAI